MNMRKFTAILLSAVLSAGIFSTTAFAYTGENAVNEGDDTSISNVEVVSESETEAGEETQALTDGYSVRTNDDGSVVVTVNGKEYTLGSGNDGKRVGTVIPGITSLHFRIGPGMDYEIMGYLYSGDQVEILEKEGDWYKVTFDGKTGYVHGNYLNVLDTSSGSLLDDDMVSLILSMVADGAFADDTDESDASLTPDGNLTLVDDIGSGSGTGQQFITLVTKAGNTFYLVIDRNDKGEENVHFLNLVDEADLLSLMDEEEAAKYQTETPVESTPEPVETTTPTETETPTESSQKEESSRSLLPMVMLLLFLIGAAGVGGYLYIKVKGGLPHKQTDKPDPDADYRDEEDEINLPEENDEDSDGGESYDEEVDEEDAMDDEPI